MSIDFAVFSQKLNSLLTPLAASSYEDIGKGPQLYFNRKLLDTRAQTGLKGFLYTKNIEDIYCVLGLWGMNTRGAKVKEFPEFCQEIENNKDALLELESLLHVNEPIPFSSV